MRGVLREELGLLLWHEVLLLLLLVEEELVEVVVSGGDWAFGCELVLERILGSVSHYSSSACG